LKARETENIPLVKLAPLVLEIGRRDLEPIPVGYFDDILMAKILCHRSLCDEYRPRESTS
jgi:hypothetical protein